MELFETGENSLLVEESSLENIFNSAKHWNRWLWVFWSLFEK